jgi:hypothetical protein
MENGTQRHSSFHENQTNCYTKSTLLRNYFSRMCEKQPISAAFVTHGVLLAMYKGLPNEAALYNGRVLFPD